MKTLPRSAVVKLGLAALVGALLLFVVSSASAANTTVPVGNFFFCSSSFQNGTCTTTISVGDTVSWSFAGATVPHTTTSDTGAWDSHPVSPGGSFQFTFTQAGSFPYHCAIHPTLMHGVIVVQAAAAATPTPPASGGTTPAASVTPLATRSAGTTGVLPSTGQ